MNETAKLQQIISEGEGLHLEFKEGVNKQLDREIIAFANTNGGSIFIGVDDANNIVGTDISNAQKGKIQDIAHNCDPRIQIELITYTDSGVLEIKVAEGHDKPYRCKDGFYVRQGECTQKLRRDEILNFITTSGAVRFDEAINERFNFSKDFSEEKFLAYLSIADIKQFVDIKDILISLNIAKEIDHDIKLTNAGVLFFTENPQLFFPESYITAVQYKSFDRFSIIDKKEIRGTLVDQINNTIQFVVQHMNMEINIGTKAGENLGQRVEIFDYPLAAIREAIINAVAHRDYLYDSSHIYIHMYPDRIEIENPGGLCRGMTADMLALRSVRRNRLIADLLYRAKYIEKIGSGYARIQNSLAENNNPPYEISNTNFFNLRLLKRLATVSAMELTLRQRKLLSFIAENQAVTTKMAATFLDVSADTVLNDLRVLVQKELVQKIGKGKNTVYVVPTKHVDE